MSDDINELRAANTRSDRNSMLNASDWTHMVSDRPLANKADWTLYRKKLRDLTLRPDFPDIPVRNFPEAPDSGKAEFDRWLYVESPAEGESVWQENPDWVDPATLPQPE